MSEKLNFGNVDLTAFDAAPAPGGVDLSAFDTATGRTTVPAGNYVLRVESGELTTTKKGKTAYRLRFKTVEPSEHAGFTLWRWFVLDDAAGINRTKAALTPLGIATAAQLREAYPPIGQDVYVRAVVTLRNDGTYGPGNDVERFTPCPAPASAPLPATANPFAVPLPTESKEGGSQ